MSQGKQKDYLGIRLTPERRQKLENMAATTGATMTDVISELIDLAIVKPMVTLSNKARRDG